MSDIALICCNALPHRFLEEVAKAKWMLYRYLVAYHLFALSDASPHLRAIVRDELLGSESLSKSGLLSVAEEEEVSKSETPSSSILNWISHLLMEVGRACDSERPCAQQLIKNVMQLRNKSAELTKDMDKATPISFLLVLYMLADLTVVLTPIGTLHMVGANHEGYSVYFMPFVATMLASCVFHGSLRLIAESADPFGNDIGENHGTNMAFLETEYRLFSLLSIHHESTVHLPHVRDDLEPIWAGEGLGWDYPVPGQGVATTEEEIEYIVRQRMAAGGFIPGLDSFSGGAEGVDDDFLSVGADSLDLSDVDHTEAAELLEELRRKPPIFNPEGRGGVDMDSNWKGNLDLDGVVLVEDALAKAKLAKSESEARSLRRQLDQRSQQLLDLQANSVPSKDAEQVIQLLAEWIAPPRPVRLSDVTLARLAEIARKQSSRVKKILSLSAGKVSGKPLQGINKPPGIQAAEVGAAKASADYKRLIQDLLERLDEENQVSLRLKTQLAEASSVNTNLGNIPTAKPEAGQASITDRKGMDAYETTDQLVKLSRPSPSQPTLQRQQSRGLTKDGRLK